MMKVLFVHEYGHPMGPPPPGMAFDVSRVQVTLGPEGPVAIYTTNGILQPLNQSVANSLGQAL